MDLKDKVAFVTGGVGNIGKSMAEILLEHGVKVYLVDMNEKRGEETLKEFRNKFGAEMVSFSVMDVTNDDQFRKVFDTAVKTYGAIHIMINSAAILNENDFERTIRVNYGGTVRGTLIAENHMRTDNKGVGGRIINVSSIQSFTSTFITPTYCGTKHAIRGFTSSMAQRPEKRQQGVQYASLCPDATERGIADVFGPHSVYPEYGHLALKIKEQVPTMSAKRTANALMQLLGLSNMTGALLYIGHDKYEYRKLIVESSETFTPEESAAMGGVL